MRGRKPKPVELKLLDGTYRKDRASREIPQQRSGSPHAPDWFDEEERKLWAKLIRHYRDQGRSIQPTEVAVHANFIHAEAERNRLVREVRALDKLVSERAVQLRIPEIEARIKMPDAWDQKRDRLHRKLRQAIESHTKLAAELGLTPSSRSRAGWTAQPKTQDDDPWALLAGGKP